jgi:hypothetical protein
MDGNVKPTAGELTHPLREYFSGTEDGVQGLGETGGQSPTQSGLGVNDWRNASRKNTGKAGMTQ